MGKHNIMTTVLRDLFSIAIISLLAFSALLLPAGEVNAFETRNTQDRRDMHNRIESFQNRADNRFGTPSGHDEDLSDLDLRLDSLFSSNFLSRLEMERSNDSDGEKEDKEESEAEHEERNSQNEAENKNENKEHEPEHGSDDDGNKEEERDSENDEKTETETKIETKTETERESDDVQSSGNFLGSVEKYIHEFTNAARVSNGLQPLENDRDLAEIAENHSEDMIEENYFAHTAPDGCDLGCRFDNSGYEYFYAGENIFYLSNRDWSAKEIADFIVDGWMESPGHRRNILSSNYTHEGIGVDRGDGRIYATQNFADPR